ncbi:peptide deformylase [Candidatus Absconditicoccus praedator]|uniref:peptide deformylase n=1 Tax=Candidatus Absconditicoccus praedator TaxID=2735562 RepID=UPI001E2C4332|nr:peptide deformylase [Candidatus Absconditicoccus praedator]UFX83075.1 peptide deformylase [Candidatus Absconditicoccus praedator]
MGSEYNLQTGLNNPILREKSVSIKEIDADILSFADVLKDMMYKYDGMGLAAPQIGVNKRIIIVTFWDESFGDLRFIDEKIMINPEIKKFSSETYLDVEGCLSLPGVEKQVERSFRVQVEYKNLNGKTKKEKLSGINARIVQHEIDHLDGILFLDKALDSGPSIGDFIR